MENTPPLRQPVLLSTPADMKDGRINPLTLAFESKNLENQFWQRQIPEMRKRSIVAISTAVFLYLIFAILDPWVVPEVLEYIWYIRGCVVIIGLWLILLVQGPTFDRWHQWIIAGMPILGGLGILLIIFLAESVGRQLYYVGLILAMIWTLLYADLRFVYALPISIGYVIIFLVLELFFSPVPIEILLNNNFFLISALLMCATGGYVLERAQRVNYFQSMQIAMERERAENLLLNILPRDIAEVLKVRNGTIADRVEEASILFADIVDFTPLSSKMGAEEMVMLLNETFSFFDSLVEKYDLEKIRTIGDNYMVAAGVPRPRSDHAHVLARMALEMCDYAQQPPPAGKIKLQFRIGINTGPVVAGIIGYKKFQYDVWGDAVNMASRMESHGVPGKIQISEKTYNLVKEDFCCVPRGKLKIKGLGETTTYFLVNTANVADSHNKNPQGIAAPAD